MSSRKIEDLIPSMKAKAGLFAAKMAEAGIPFMFTCTARSRKEQIDLYAQGRTRPGPIVTWTLDSNHIPRPEDDGGARAFDIAILKNGKPTWDAKVDVNDDDRADYIQAGEIGESVGLRWGGRFRRPDMPHFEEID